jgi:hypothetical protein
LPGELAKHVVAEGTKAISKYANSKWTTKTSNPTGLFRATQIWNPKLLRFIEW